jgi:hypothetical protein
MFEAPINSLSQQIIRRALAPGFDGKSDKEKSPIVADGRRQRQVGDECSEQMPDDR